MTSPSAHQPLLAGRPADNTTVLPAPDTLYLPLTSRRLCFSDTRVRDGQAVRAGQVLARDPDHWGIPLLAPRAGTARTMALDGHIVLEVGPVEVSDESDLPGVDAKTAEAELPGKRADLLQLGGWQFVRDARTDAIADPTQTPRAVIIVALALDSFVAQPDALLEGRVLDFARGIAALTSAVGSTGCQYHLLVGKGKLSELVSGAVREAKLHGRLMIHHVPQVYPHDNAQLAMQTFRMANSADDVVWCIGVDGMLAIKDALVDGKPCVDRTVAVGGPAIQSPRHVRAPIGHPVADILAPLTVDDTCRVINGGFMSGADLAPGQRGLDGECVGLTVLDDPPGREFVGFMRPGLERQSFSRCFLEALFPRVPVRLTPVVGGEERACVACGYCEQICPAGLLPQVLHRYLYNEQMDDAHALGLNLCVECGLCSYVCPCKIELREQFSSAKHQLRCEDDDASMAV